jgi:FkbM family methyltransferase
MKTESYIEISNALKSFDVKNYVQVGAYNGHEGELYNTLNTDTVVWIEPTPHMFEYLKDNTKKYTNIKNQIYFDFVISDIIGEIEFNLIGNPDGTQPNGVNLGCSSILELKEHANLYPQIQKIETIKRQSITLDALYQQYNIEKPGFLNMDVQGAELKVLLGAPDLLKNHIKVILAETAEVEMYHTSVIESDLTQYLNTFGFTKCNYWKHDTMWGDTLYIKSI